MDRSVLLKPSFAAAIFACLALAACPKIADSDTATTTFLVQANVATTCEISATGLVFGTYATTAASTGTSIITVVCTSAHAYTVGLDAGKAPGATVTTRQMLNVDTPTAPPMNYNLFSDSAMTKNWGNTTADGAVAGIGTGLAQTLTVYGQIPAAQNTVETGAYQDTITATLTF